MVLRISQDLYRETISQLTLSIAGSDAKDIAVDICSFDRLVLTNDRNPIIGVDLSFDTSYSFIEWGTLVEALLIIS